MRHVIAFSGGKDSTALICWGQENLPAFTAVFCDTGWEHPVTYAYTEYINQKLLGGGLVRLPSEGMEALVARKGRVPSAKARFCTEALKVEPMKRWIAAQNDEMTLYQGIRADESHSRAGMSESEFSDVYDAQVERPLFRWTAEQCFDLLRAHGVEPNPLYLAGARRVGCFPCVMITHGELDRVRKFHPEVWDRAEALERIAGRSFFPPNYIPTRYHSGRCVVEKDCSVCQGIGTNTDPENCSVCEGSRIEEVQKTFPTLADVRRYIEAGDKQRGFWEENSPSCLSIYGGLCE